MTRKPARPKPPPKPEPLASIAGVPVHAASRDQYDAAVGAPAGTGWQFGAAGYYSWGDGSITLLNNTIHQLEQVNQTGVGGKHDMTVPEAVSIFTFTHEIGHSTGIVDEKAADRFAARYYPEVAYRLGLRGRQNYQQLADFEHLYGPAYGSVDPGAWPGGNLAVGVFPTQPPARG